MTYNVIAQPSSGRVGSLLVKLPVSTMIVDRRLTELRDLQRRKLESDNKHPGPEGRINVCLREERTIIGGTVEASSPAGNEQSDV
jgi:hypothetical protein